MDRAQVPTAHYTTAEDLYSALAALQEFTYPCVIKADGLAAGKGVVIVSTYEEAVVAVTALLEERSLGDAGARIVIEELLTGPEVSIFAITDGLTVRVLPPACDHKRAFDGEQGPNTGGMGAYAPTSLVNSELMTTIERTILVPTLNEMRQQDMPFIGVLYAGLILTANGPRVIEFNARFGDPEAQVVLPLIEGDLAEVLYSAATGDLANVQLNWQQGTHNVGVVMASAGYPGPYERFAPITGIEAASNETVVFQAGTMLAADGALVTNGGRILTVVGTGATMAEAKLLAYVGVEHIEIAGAFFRRDIGYREPD
jgi:phosphoribosylamine--glycine ligase